MVTPRKQSQKAVRRTSMLAAWILVALGARVALAEGPDGAEIYRQHCASCHGAHGEGTPEDYPDPLTGKRSVAQLAKLIARTMPADDPGVLGGEEAEAVAAYIYDAFYSPIAQARNAPARVALSRLTVRQYRNTLADLVGTFREGGTWDERRGLQASYYEGRRMRRNGAIERIDPGVRFDFGTGSPDAEKIKPAEFSIRWEGSVLAPETGEYTFVVRTDHAARLWVNDPDRPLIDAWVKSGDDTEYAATIPLLGGRAYPIRLEFSKAKQGVDDSKDRKGEPPPVHAMVYLEWEPPGGVREVVPGRLLSPNRMPRTFVVTAPFPPDDRSIGYERGTSVSKAWDEATTEAAIETADYVVEHLNELADTRDGNDDRGAKLRDFARRFVERAFRRPLTDAQVDLYVDRQFAGIETPEAAIKRVVLLTLKSPRFLYLGLGEDFDAYAMASRLSFGLWDSLPDRALLGAAASGRLATREDVTREARRMMDDLRTRSKLRAFFHQWLKIDGGTEIAKDDEQYPGFDDAIVADLRTSLDLFLDEVAWGASSDFRRLLRAESIPINGRLANFYGVDLPTDAPFQDFPLEPGQRAGVLTHPYLMAHFAYTSTTSPIHRGVFLARGVLGRALRPPPAAFTPLAPDLHPDLSTRERVALQTSPDACIKCHKMINPLGFALEHFDAVGRYRAEEKGRPIDATGWYETLGGATVEFDGARALAEFLAGSDEVHEAFVEALFHHLVKQPARAFGPEALPTLSRAFADRGYQIRELMVETIAATALTPPETPSQTAGELPDDPFAGEPAGGWATTPAIDRMRSRPETRTGG